MRLYLTRHGQTEWNLLGKYQGWLNSPLTDRGKMAAKQLGERLEKVKFQAVYSSDLGRAVETTKALNRKETVILDERIREIDLGIWSGLSYHEAPKAYPELYHQYIYEPLAYQPQKGESLLEFYERVETFVKMLDKQHPNDTVLVVCHGITLIMLQLVLNGQTVEKKLDYPVPGGAHLFIANRKQGLTEWETIDDGSHIL